MKLSNILNALGIILVAFGAIMLTPIAVALLMQEYNSIVPFITAALTSVSLGLLFRKYGGFSRNFDNIRRDEGMLIVSLAWVVTGAMGAIPYLFYGLHPVDARPQGRGYVQLCEREAMPWLQSPVDHKPDGFKAHEFHYASLENLPDDIVLRWLQPIDESFHARFSARARRYRYIILNHQVRPALLNNKVCWYRDALDEKQMQIAAHLLLGENDFSSFRAAGCQAKHAMRELQDIQITREGHFIYIDIVANAFLHHNIYLYVFI